MDANTNRVLAAVARIGGAVVMDESGDIHSIETLSVEHSSDTNRGHFLESAPRPDRDDLLIRTGSP